MIFTSNGSIRECFSETVSLEAFFEKVYPKLEEFGDFKRFSNLGEGNTLVANESKVLFSFEFEEDKIEAIGEYLQISDDDLLPFNMEVIYSSMYDEKWKIDVYKGGHPVRLTY